MIGPISCVRADDRNVSTLRKLWDWWRMCVWIPTYCRFCWFHLARSKTTGAFWVIFGPPGTADSDAPDGHYWVVGCITPWGARHGAASEQRWERFCEIPGMVEAMKKALESVRMERGKK